MAFRTNVHANWRGLRSRSSMRIVEKSGRSQNGDALGLHARGHLSWSIAVCTAFLPFKAKVKVSIA